MKKIILLFYIVFAVGQITWAQDTLKRYHLFRPVPKAKLREMETDRPDVTESPITVDAGHFQYETDLFRLERSRHENTLSQTYLLNQANLKLGLSGSTDVQLVLQSFNYVREKDLKNKSVDRVHGFGDLTLRIKQNLLGNNSGNFALALMPYYKFATAGTEEQEQAEWGVIVPMSLRLPGDWKLGMQLETDRLQDEEGTALHTQFLESLTLGHKIIGKLDGIAETYYTYNLKEHHWNNFLNAALQLEVAKDVKIDGGINYGIQHDAMKSYFVGLSFRL